MVGPQGNLLNRIEKFLSNILFADKCIVSLIYSYMVTNYNKFKLFEIVLHNFSFFSFRVSGFWFLHKMGCSQLIKNTCVSKGMDVFIQCVLVHVVCQMCQILMMQVLGANFSSFSGCFGSGTCHEFILLISFTLFSDLICKHS